MICYLDPLFFICWALTDSGDVIFFVCKALVDFSTVLLLLPYQEQERAVRCKADDLLAELQHDVFEADPFAWLKDTLEKLPTWPNSPEFDSWPHKTVVFYHGPLIKS